MVNDRFELRGLVTVKGIDKAARYPRSCKDGFGWLWMGASIAAGPDTDERVAALVAVAADAVKVGVGPYSICTTRGQAQDHRPAVHRGV